MPFLFIQTHFFTDGVAVSSIVISSHARDTLNGPVVVVACL